MLDGFEWLQLPATRGGALQLDDPDAAALLEEAAIVEWIEEGAPPIEGARVEAPAMPRKAEPVEVPPVALAVDQKQAAALLGVHPDTFRSKVLPHLRVVDITPRAQRITVRELERFLSSREGYALRSER